MSANFFTNIGGISYLGTDVKNQSVSKNDGKTVYTVELLNGIQLKYAEQTPDSSSTSAQPQVTLSDNNETSIWGIKNAEILGSNREDNISLFDCENNIINVANDDFCDSVTISGKSPDNTVIRGDCDTVSKKTKDKVKTIFKFRT